MSYRRSYIGTDRPSQRWSYIDTTSRSSRGVDVGDTPRVPRGVDRAPSTFVPAPYEYRGPIPSRSQPPTTPIPKYNPWYTAYTPFYPTYYRGYSHMITSCKDYLNPGFFQPDKDESSMVERHKELKQQEDERKKLIEETKTHYSRLVGQVPQIGVDKDSQRTDYGRLARYLSTYGSGNTTNLLRFLDSGCTKEPIAVEVPKHVDGDDDSVDEHEDDDDEEEWVKAPIKHGFVKAGAPPPFLRNDSGPAKDLAPPTPKHARSEPPEMLTRTTTMPTTTTEIEKPEGKSERRPFRYASKGGGVGGGGGGGDAEAVEVKQGAESTSRRSASREGSAGSVKRRVKVPKKRETETIYIIPETLSDDVLAKVRIRRDTDFLMQGLVL